MSTKNQRKRIFVALISGFIFAIGLGLAGMTQPQKVLGFLDVQHWDPSLLFVMGGAITVHVFAYFFASRKSHPLFDSSWHYPKRNDVTLRLVLGAALFGVGWGLGGFCPGPGLVSLFSGDLRSLTFVTAMILGMWIFGRISRMNAFRFLSENHANTERHK